MTIWNLGSINADHFYHVPHIPAPGETLACSSLRTGLGGKGANMSVAAARAGAHVAHIGAVGPEGGWARDRLMEYGVDTRHIAQVAQPTGHAIIAVADGDGENTILLFGGANHAIDEAMVGAALSSASTGDTFLFQNETSAQGYAAETAAKLGLRVAYAAAPFDAAAARAALPFLDFLILNEIEAEQLGAAVGKPVSEMGVTDVIVTLGGAGCDWYHRGEKQSFSAVPVTPVDTTGAGDTFTGYVLAGLDRGMSMAQGISLAMRAAALKVTRAGTADVIPDLAEVEAFASAPDKGRG
ncbi:ribokinase [Poseidonocella sedimentorum]|uniref:Ribokinase n=1 Tax=Poseidonocella sedimentorum TaxID=871652 RepID=A0A1I6D636_9RHOB|nr:ribokinase [Poseidonocella sedimentorum]SFR00925.1 ribokinase [Poseidonocella sedimentorum]